MALGSPGRRDEPLHVVPMALALALAAALGGAAGVIWQWIGLGDDDEAAAPPEEAPPAEK